MLGVSYVRMRDRFKTTRRVEARGQLVGERLIVDKAVCAGRADGLFVEALGIELAALNACNLRANQRGAVFEILRAIFCPYFQLSVVRRPEPRNAAVAGRQRGVTACGVGQRAIEVIFRRFKKDADAQSSRCALNEASTAAA